MAFYKLCESDPIGDFIRQTYDAIPLRVPDSRFEPLSIIASKNDNLRFLGSLSSDDFKNKWNAPSIGKQSLPDVSSVFSNKLSWNVVLDLLGPFLKNLFSIPDFSINGSIQSKNEKSQKVSFSLGRVSRSSINPISCARSLAESQISIPGIAGSPTWTYLLVDSILTAREFSLVIEGEKSSEMAAHIESDIAGKISVDAVLRKGSNLSITGVKPTPFAITCLKIEMSDSGVIKGIKIPEKSNSLGATALEGLLPVERVILGNVNQLIFFNDEP